MAPFDPSHTSFYSPFIVTMALSSIVCEIWRLIGRKSRNFYTPPVFSAPAGGGWPRRNFVKMFDADKTNMIGLPYGTWTLRTDGQTDGQTDRYPISISRVSVLTRDKKSPYFYFRLDERVAQTCTAKVSGTYDLQWYKKAFGGGSQCGNRISGANVCIAFRSICWSILLSFRDMTTGRTTDDVQTDVGHQGVSRHQGRSTVTSYITRTCVI